MATTLSDPNFSILYVENVAASVSFYSRLLQREPVESSANFALYVLPSGSKFGLWSKKDVLPVVTAPAGGSEHCLVVSDIPAVRAVHNEWANRGVKILQEPTQMDFGFTFVAGDPDGHRLRVFVPTEA